MKILLESSAIIEYLKGNKKAKEILDKAEDFYVSSLSAYEILLGKINENKILDFLSAFKILSITLKDSLIASRIYKRLRDKGMLIGSFDILIASQAINRDLTLVTKDTDFLRIKEEYKNLKLFMLS
ncbi:type II toxin-antitoxin system VapC family toxin [Sulfurisphaera tokodaii]|uniref:PIN domain protein n=2 Tax=Sulfurisphaera tokodaii TaxID=111955 RepID=Q972K7_SULTO|nr:type II toxin-antitoxin system VapC family toxin [Sulfurisphaera tokodaii]BAB66159.1 PIN domain protein [Sulfurisphaera tokodaii str. 7]HII74168.1 type II toxin-antitoxin system VapC family toxin [Sulfurisphaera tokodaii]